VTAAAAKISSRRSGYGKNIYPKFLNTSPLVKIRIFFVDGGLVFGIFGYPEFFLLSRALAKRKQTYRIYNLDTVAAARLEALLT
jgi:hypothetical protein